MAPWLPSIHENLGPCLKIPNKANPHNIRVKQADDPERRICVRGPDQEAKQLEETVNCIRPMSELRTSVHSCCQYPMLGSENNSLECFFALSAWTSLPLSRYAWKSGSPHHSANMIV